MKKFFEIHEIMTLYTNKQLNLVGAMFLGYIHEIDFVIPHKHKISPVEVKSSGYKTHKSLDVSCSKFSGRIMSKYLIYTKDYKRENGVEYNARRALENEWRWSNILKILDEYVKFQMRPCFAIGYDKNSSRTSTS